MRYPNPKPGDVLGGRYKILGPLPRNAEAADLGNVTCRGDETGALRRWQARNAKHSISRVLVPSNPSAGLGYGPPPSAPSAHMYQQKTLTVAPGGPRPTAAPAPAPAVVQQGRLQMPLSVTPKTGYRQPQDNQPSYVPAWHPDAQNGNPPAATSRSVPWPLVIAGVALAVFTS